MRRFIIGLGIVIFLGGCVTVPIKQLSPYERCIERCEYKHRKCMMRATYQLKGLIRALERGRCAGHRLACESRCKERRDYHDSTINKKQTEASDRKGHE